MRILHTSDWHLGRQFHQLSLLRDQRAVLDQIIDVAETRSVDVVLIAGDIYDRSVPAAEAVSLLDDVIDELNGRLGIPIVLISGNHDGPERLGFGARQFARAGVHIASVLRPELHPVVLQDRHGDVAFYPLPYADPARVRDVFEIEVHSHEAALAAQLERVRADNPAGRRCVVLAHCFLHGGQVSESERPLSVGGVDQVPARLFEDFAYAALGHLHGPQHRGAAHVRYSGSPLKYSFSEANHKKSVSLVELDRSGRVEVEEIALTPPRDTRIIAGMLDDVLAAGRNDPHSEDYVLVRLHDTSAILDAMGKLRSVYPNTLHLERPALSAMGEYRTVTREQLERGHLALFRDFHLAMTSTPLVDEDAKLIAGMLDEINLGSD